jgi:hypothetical protein
MTTPLLRRILRDNSLGDDLLEALAERLPPTDLQSLLLEVFRRRAARQTPADLLAQYERNPYVAPSTVNPQTLMEFDRVAFSLAASRFEPVELSPACPLGTNSVVANLDQNQTVATVRNTELVSDSTNVLALECARRRRDCLRTTDRLREPVRLCASHRLLRPHFKPMPGTHPHFRAFTLCTAGRDEGAFRFEIAALVEHLRFYLRLLSQLSQAGWEIDGLRVTLTDLAGGMRQEAIQTKIVHPLKAEFPSLFVEFDPDRVTGRNYYREACFHIYAKDREGLEYQLADGGFTDWTQQLLSSRKERLLISGMGTERVCSMFARQTGETK